MAQTWAERRAGLAQVLDYYEACVAQVKRGQAAAAEGVENEEELVAALMSLSELEGPPEGCVEVEVDIEVPNTGLMN